MLKKFLLEGLADGRTVTKLSGKNELPVIWPPRCLQSHRALQSLAMREGDPSNTEAFIAFLKYPQSSNPVPNFPRIPSQLIAHPVWKSSSHNVIVEKDHLGMTS